MLSKCQQVFASAHKDIQMLTWNFHSENSTKIIFYLFYFIFFIIFYLFI